MFYGFITSSHLSNVEPQNQEDEKTKCQQIIDVILVIRFGQFQNFPDGVGEHGMCRIKLVVHRFQKLVLLLDFSSDVYGQRLQRRYLALQLAFKILVVLLQRLIPVHIPRGVRVTFVTSV